METAILDWLGNVGATAFRWSALGFVLLNGAAATAIVLTRDRALVNRWTGRLLAANLVLVGTGVGVPLVAAVGRVAVAVVLPSGTPVVHDVDREEAMRAVLSPVPVR